MELEEYTEMVEDLGETDRRMLREFMEDQQLDYDDIAEVNPDFDTEIQVMLDDGTLWTILVHIDEADKRAMDDIQENFKDSWKLEVQNDETEQGFDDWCDDQLTNNGAYAYLPSYDGNVYETGRSCYPYYRIE